LVGGDGLPTGAYRYYTQALCRGTTEERWGTVYIGATSCTVKRATRADLRLTPLSLPLAPHPTRRRSLALSFPFSIPLAPLFSSPPSLSPTLSRLSRRARSDAAQLPLAGLTQPNPRANFIPRRLTTTDGRRRVLDAAVAVVVVVVVVRHRTRSRDTSTWSSANRCFDVRASFSYPSVFSSSCRRWCISAVRCVEQVLLWLGYTWLDSESVNCAYRLACIGKIKRTRRREERETASPTYPVLPRGRTCLPDADKARRKDRSWTCPRIVGNTWDCSRRSPRNHPRHRPLQISWFSSQRWVIFFWRWVIAFCDEIRDWEPSPSDWFCEEEKRGKIM